MSFGTSCGAEKVGIEPKLHDAASNMNVGFGRSIPKFGTTLQVQNETYDAANQYALCARDTFQNTCPELIACLYDGRELHGPVSSRPAALIKVDRARRPRTLSGIAERISEYQQSCPLWHHRIGVPRAEATGGKNLGNASKIVIRERKMNRADILLQPGDVARSGNRNDVVALRQ